MSTGNSFRCVLAVLFINAGVVVAQSLGSWVGNRRVSGSNTDQKSEQGLLAGVVPVYLLGTTKVPLSKALNP